MQAGEGTAAGETPGLVGERTPMSTDQPGLDDDPAGRTVPRGTVQPDDIPRPVTTPTPTPERDSPRGIEAVPPAGQPAPGVRVEPLPGSVPTRPGGNLGPDPMGPAGGNGTIEGNAPAGGSTGGATTDGPTGGAAGPGDED